MKGHNFIFQPGIWEGEGSIQFSMAEDLLPFKVKWTVLSKDDQKIYLIQNIDIEGFSEKSRNHFCLTEITESTFSILLENGVVGQVGGKGVIDETNIAWEFRKSSQGFEGYETYERLADGSYRMRAEYMAQEGFFTSIHATLKLSNH